MVHFWIPFQLDNSVEIIINIKNILALLNTNYLMKGYFKLILKDR